MKIQAILIAAIVAVPALAKEKERAPNSLRGESKVVTFHCVAEDSGSIDGIGMARLSPSKNKSYDGSVDLKLYLKNNKVRGSMQAKIISGLYTLVPEGVILRTEWNGPFAEHILLHLHPEEKTSFPNLAGKSQCAIDQELSSIGGNQ